MSDDEEQRHSDVEEEDSDAERERHEEDERRKEDEESRRAEAAAERQRKQEEKKKKEEQEASKKRKPGQKRKGLGGLSPEKKRLLKQLIMQKAADEMKAETKKRQEEKENYLKGKVKPLEVEGLNEGQLESKCKELYGILKTIESEKYDWEEKIRRQDFEINELTIKVNDVKGKFVKPVLKRVSKADMTMARLEGKKHTSTLGSLKTQLKSTGQNKFALEEKNEHEKADWRNELKAKEDEAEA